MTKIDRTKVSQLFAKSEGKFFSCFFRKLDGSIRDMRGIILVQEDIATRYLTVYDIEVDGVRRVNIDTLYRLEVAGTDYRIAG